MDEVFNSHFYLSSPHQASNFFLSFLSFPDAMLDAAAATASDPDPDPRHL